MALCCGGPYQQAPQIADLLALRGLEGRQKGLLEAVFRVCLITQDPVDRGPYPWAVIGDRLLPVQELQ